MQKEIIGHGKAQSTPQTTMAHHLILEERKELTVQGVLKVLYCDESSAAMDTPVGRLQVVGKGLSVSELSLQTGEVRIQGELTEVAYSETKESAGGLLRHILR